MRLHRLMGALLAALLVLTGCGDDEDSAPTSGENGTTTITVGVLPIGNAAPLYLGMEKGFFREEGLELKPHVAQSGNELVATLVSGDSEVAFLGYVPVIVARAQGLPLKVVANADNGADTAAEEWQVILSRKGSDIREPADLEGKTIAVNALGGVAEVGLKAALEAEGADPGSIKLLEIPFPEMPAALEARRIDAIWGVEPFLTQALGEGAQEVLAPYPSLGKAFPNGTYATTDSYLEENADVMERFTRAMNRSSEYATENPDEARAVIPTFTQIPEAVAQEMRLPLWPTEIDRAQLEDLIGYTQKYGIIEETFPVEEMIWEGAQAP
jgi:NitT/TauT family transport system substrate-binding protein